MDEKANNVEKANYVWRRRKKIMYMWAKDLDSPNLGELRFVPAQTAASGLTTVLLLAQYQRAQTSSKSVTYIKYHWYKIPF